MSPLIRWIAVLTVFVGSAIESAHAQTEFCVRNEAELTVALGALGNSTLDPLVIKLAQGTYDTSLTPLGGSTNGDRPLSILGGYNSTCTTRSEDPSLTTLTSTANSSSVWINTDGDISLDRLRILEISFVFLRAESSFSGDYAITISRVLFDSALSLRLPGNDEILIENSVFWRGGNPQNGNCGLTIGDSSPDLIDRIVIRNNTFVGNRGVAALCIGNTSESSDWTVNLTNNVFRVNNNADIRLRKPASQGAIAATVRHNIYAALDASPPLAALPVSTLNVDPLFVNPAIGNFRLQSTSLAINAGRIDANLLAERDFDGNPRWFGDAPDRGAFESNIGTTSPVITVTNSNDSGAGSLRQALNDANAAPNLNTIRFNISGACPRTITLASLLPDITQPVSIEGYTQPGSNRNSANPGWNATLCIVLNGNNQITGAFGFNVNTGASADATVSIEGIAFSGHSFAAAQFVAGRDHRFVGNQIGGTVGAALLASGTGVRIGGSVEGARVGGPDPENRNVIADALGTGVSITGSGSIQPTLAVVENNYIGTQSGGDNRGNERGVFVSGSDHVIRNNVIANQVSHGIELSGLLATGNRLTGNRIGVPALCLGTCADRGNGGHGVLIRNSAADNRVESNQIAFNGLDGIAVTGARHNALLRNTSYDNDGIGIDLGDDGRNLFDANNTQTPPATAGNDSQNYPSITEAAGTPALGLVAGQLNSTNGWYRLDFYGIPSTTACTLAFAPGPTPAGFFGEGRDWIGSTFVQISNATASANGSVSYTDVPIRRENSSNYFVAGSTWITATATRLSGQPSLISNPRPLGTSEFGRCRQFVAGSLPDPLFSNGFEAAGP
jgi:hypothetical protein